MKLINLHQKSFYLPADTTAFLSKKKHSHTFTLTRSSLIVGRIQQIANFFALLSLCWIGIDILFMSQTTIQQLAICRIITSILFVLLAFSCSQAPNITKAYFHLLLLFFIPISFLFGSFYFLQFADSGSKASALIAVYSHSPFLIAAGACFFPLTILEFIFLLGIPILLAISGLFAFYPEILGLSSWLSIIWILLLILATSAMSSFSQLGFMLKLFDDTAYDSLTGLFNRKVGMAVLNQQFQASVRQKTPFTVLFVDLDHFKNINDQLGHDAGDAVLRDVAHHLKKTIRGQDLAIRWGGEEFLISLPSTDAINAKIFLSRLKAQSLAICKDGRTVTASIGVVERMADKTEDLAALIALADKRMYLAKQNGRNCCVFREGDQ